MNIDLGIYRSKEELYFSWYLDELIENGYVSWYRYESKTFTLLEEAKSTWDRKLKSGKVIATLLHIAQDVEYTPDFEISFTEKALGVFCNGIPSYTRPYFMGMLEDEILGHYIAFIDVKGSAFINSSSSISFSFTQKLMWHRYMIYVQKVIPQNLFNKTFTPKRYLLTDGGKAIRNSKGMKYVISIEEFIEKIN